MPGRRLTSPADFNIQLQPWFAVVNTRRRRALGCAPTDGIGANKAAMLTLPPGRASDRLAGLNPARA